MIEPGDEWDDWQFSSDGFKKAQGLGKCGERQNNGGLCKNAITEWLTLDPDRPATTKIGACGMHVSQVSNRIKNLQARVYDRRIELYEKAKTESFVRALRAVGFKIAYHTSRYDDSVTIMNPGEFLHTLHKLGILEKFGIDLAASPCGAAHPTSYRTLCKAYKGHDGQHDDWQGRHWDDPPPPAEGPPPCEFEPIVAGANVCKKCSKLESEHNQQEAIA